MLVVIGLVVTSLLGLLAEPTAGQDTTLVVENGRIIVGDGTVLEGASVVVAGDRIVSVVPEVVEVPEARHIDASGRTVLPGLIDTHVHLLVPSTALVPRGDSVVDAFIQDELPGRLERLLKAGVTTVMSTGDFWPHVREVRDRVRSGELAGPRIFTSGPVFTVPGGHPAATVCGPRGGRGPNPWCRRHMAVEVATRTEAREAVNRLAREGVDLIKMVYDSVSPPDVAQMRPELVEEIVAAAHDRGLRAYAHAYEIDNAINAVQSGLDGLVHTPWLAADAGERVRLAEVMHSQGVIASTTLLPSSNLRERFVRHGNAEEARYLNQVWVGIRQAAATLAEAGDGLLALGTDVPGIPGDEAYRLEIFHAVEAGLTPPQVIAAATRNAAIHMGRADDLGTLEAGKLADLIIVEGDPLDHPFDLWNVAVVVKGGEVLIEH